AAAIQMISHAGTSTLNNSGSISVDGEIGYAFAVLGADVADTVNNSGDISGSIYLYAGDNVVNNTGTIALGDGALETGDGDDAVSNAGNITGAISLSGGGDVFNNLAGGALNLAGATLDTGDGDDTIDNAGSIVGLGSILTGSGDDTINNTGTIDLAAGTGIDLGDGDDTFNTSAVSTLTLQDASILMGAGSANAFNNSGKLVVRGDSLIDMGSGASGGTPAPVSFGQVPAMSAIAPTAVPALNATPFVTDGVIGFVDGATDDTLTIVGDFTGSGAIHIDLSMLNNASDQLYVDGSIVDGTAHRVNVEFTEIPDGTEQPVAFAHVSGDAAAGSFVPGMVTGFSDGNFMSLGVAVLSDIDSSNASDDVFSVGIDVLGLNDTGSLAASIASGAAGLVNSQIGTFRQRLGVNPYGDPGKVMSAFVRMYTDEGDVTATHQADNFGSAGNFDFNQSTWGREVGINANLFGNFHAGIVLGNADSRQRMIGEGHGENRMDGMTWGAYATWYVPQGFYVDLSGRWMAVDVRSTSSAGTMSTRAHTAATSIEAGYQWAFGNGLVLVPQAQYTRTKVDGIRLIEGAQTSFDAHGGTFSRGRLGVELNKQFETTSGIRYTPYASINAIREFDGETTYE